MCPKLYSNGTSYVTYVHMSLLSFLSFFFSFFSFGNRLVTYDNDNDDNCDSCKRSRLSNHLFLTNIPIISARSPPNQGIASHSFPLYNPFRTPSGISGNWPTYVRILSIFSLKMPIWGVFSIDRTKKEGLGGDLEKLF